MCLSEDALTRLTDEISAMDQVVGEVEAEGSQAGKNLLTRWRKLRTFLDVEVIDASPFHVHPHLRHHTHLDAVGVETHGHGHVRGKTALRAVEQ